MRTTTEIFADTKEILRVQAVTAIDEALHKIYSEYLPHVESDTQSNVYFQTCDWLRKFFEGKLESDDIKMDFGGYSARAARDVIFDEHKTEILEAIGKDLQDKCDSLQAQLNAAYRGYS